MSTRAKEYATEIDCKVRQIRKKAATFAYGCITENGSRIEPVKQRLAAEQQELTQIESHCADFARNSEQLDQVLEEADETASKIFARLSEMYADLGLDMPTIDEDELPIGIPVERLVRKVEPEEVLEEEDVTEELASRCTSEEDVSDSDFKPNIVISRPSDSGGPPTWTPMIKSKARSVTGALAAK